MNPDIFRAFSIRGIADEQLHDDVVRKIGCAIGTFFLDRGGDLITVGWDIRVSSERISKAVINGLLQAGISVNEVGAVPTPVLNFATDYYKSDGGVMVTASHNPPEYNGLKIRSSVTLGERELYKIYTLALASPCNPPLAEGARHEKLDPIPAYLEKIKERSRTPMATLRIVVDGLDGINGTLAPNLLRDLGHEVLEINCVPDGTFPHGTPDPTDSEALNTLVDTVRQERADVGLAYDGDGDRIAVVDELGRVVEGDQLLMLFARDILSDDNSTVDPVKVVYEVLCSQAVADDVTQQGGVPIIAPSGYFYVHQALQEHGALIGGELSGHFFFKDPDFRFDDSLLATIKLLNLLTDTEDPLSKLVDALPSYYSSHEIRLPCSDTAKAAVVNSVRQHYESMYPVQTVDGVRIHFPDAWALVRQSNTQPVISMRFEAQSQEAVEATQAEVTEFVIRSVQELSNRNSE